MVRYIGLLVTLLWCSGWSEMALAQSLEVKGRWLRSADGTVMVDPQPSGLMLWQQQLLSVSDRSAHVSQRLKIHPIDASRATLNGPQWPIKLANGLKDSCFADYVTDNPDLEALTADPHNPKAFVTVTEDASRSTLTPACAKRYGQSGSTAFPTLLLRLELQHDDSLLVTGMRPVRFAPEYRVGNFPNDGIEGLAVTPGGTLYLALEKDLAIQPRIFQITIDERFWQSQAFIDVEDAELLLPEFASGNHPINGLAYYNPGQGAGFLLAAARNDDQLWILDLDKALPTRMLQLTFLAEAGGDCDDWQPVTYTAIEGLAVQDQTLWMMNDPWKENYLKNVICDINRPHFQNMSALLFKLPLNPLWFKKPM